MNVVALRVRAVLVVSCAALGLGACAGGGMGLGSASVETTGSASPDGSASLAATSAPQIQPAPGTYAVAAAPAAAMTPAVAGKPAKPGACVGTQISVSVPPVPNKAASIAGGVVENAGRNAVRNTATNVVTNQVTGRIPGFGGVVGAAATQTAAKEALPTAEDVRGTWTATDGSPRCGCQVEFSKTGMWVSDYVVAPKGCMHPGLAGAARFKIVDTGVASQDLVLLAADNTTEVARLDRKGLDYFQGNVGGVTMTVWR